MYRCTDIDYIERKFADGDYILRSILKCSYTIQRQIGFKEGQQYKQKLAVKKYKEDYV